MLVVMYALIVIVVALWVYKEGREEGGSWLIDSLIVYYPCIPPPHAVVVNGPE